MSTPDISTAPHWDKKASRKRRGRAIRKAIIMGLVGLFLTGSMIALLLYLNYASGKH